MIYSILHGIFKVEPELSLTRCYPVLFSIVLQLTNSLTHVLKVLEPASSVSRTGRQIKEYRRMLQLTDKRKMLDEV